MPTLHDVLVYLAILAGGLCVLGLGLWYLTRNEDANREKDQKAYEESRLYPD